MFVHASFEEVAEGGKRHRMTPFRNLDRTPKGVQREE